MCRTARSEKASPALKTARIMETRPGKKAGLIVAGMASTIHVSTLAWTMMKKMSKKMLMPVSIQMFRRNSLPMCFSALR